MSLSDCPECWDTLCTCGYMYRGWNVTQLRALIVVLQRLVDCDVAKTVKSVPIGR